MFISYYITANGSMDTYSDKDIYLHFLFTKKKIAVLSDLERVVKCFITPPAVALVT